MNALTDLAREFLFTREPYKKQKLGRLIRMGLTYLFVYVPLTWYYRWTRRKNTFQFAGKRYRYFYHLYNATWRNDRAVEIPIVVGFLWNYYERMLEVGNVLRHYYPRLCHTVLDKYESGECIIGNDITTYKPSAKYDLAVSISTLEHIGWDESPRHPEKLFQAIDNLRRNVLKVNGRMMITLPIGYNSYLDDLLAQSKLPFESMRCLRRASHKSKDWREVPWTPSLVLKGTVKEGYGTTVLVIAILRGISS